jgi:hypothetical protein
LKLPTMVLGGVKIGDSFVYNTETPKTPFIGETLKVVGFTPPRYKNRVVLQRPSGEEVLFPLFMVQQELGIRQA